VKPQLDVVFTRGNPDVRREAGRVRVWVTPGEPIHSVARRLDEFCRLEGLPYAFAALDDELLVPTTKDHHEAELQVQLQEERLTEIDRSAEIYKGKLSGSDYLDWRGRWEMARSMCVAGLLVARHLRDALRRHDEVKHLKRRIEGLEESNRALRDALELRALRTSRPVSPRRDDARVPLVVAEGPAAVALADGAGADAGPSQPGAEVG
jgi:hypothetical protein